MSVVLITRFKNEAHIMYEFINHYLLEGVNKFILIDDNSTDNYLEKNKWLNELISAKTVVIKKSKFNQFRDANRFLKLVKNFKWVISCDMDEFIFSVRNGSWLKGVLNNRCDNYDYIRVNWKLFTHTSKNQPASVIENNVYTHTESKDPSSIIGLKCIAKTEFLKSIGPHEMRFHKQVKMLHLKNCHNNIIQINHYRTQSDEFLYGVKEQRGGGVSKLKYTNFNRHKVFNYDKSCFLLRNKRSGLIGKLNMREQVRPEIHKDSSFAKAKEIEEQ